MTAAALIAAGASRRFGKPKQCLGFRGEPLVRVLASELLLSTCHRVGVVLGCHAAETRAALAGLYVDEIFNERWDDGMGTSVSRAAEWAVELGATSLVVATVDQALLTQAHVNALVAAHRISGAPVASSYEGVIGVPAVFGAAELVALRALRGDQGARHLLRERPSTQFIEWGDGAMDIDEPADLLRLS